MATLSKSFFHDYKSAEHILILLNEHVPAQMAFWFSLISRIASMQGKHISVLVSKESEGWGAQVDSHFPVDMILELDELTQTVKIPFSGPKESFKDINYEVEEGEISISVMPESSRLLLDSIKVEESGSSYDMIIGIGVNASHSLIDTVAKSRTYTDNVAAYMLGTFAVHAAYKKKLERLNNINVVSEGISRFMLQSIKGFINGDLDKETTANALAFLYNFQFNPNIPEQFNKEVYSCVASLNVSDEIVNTASVAFSLASKKEVDVINVFLDNMSVYANGKCNVYQFPKEKLTELGVSVNEVIVAINNIPTSSQVEDVIIAIQAADRQNYLYYEGKASTTRRIAQKYGFSMVDNSTVGLIEEVYTSKVLMDTIRIATNEEDPVEDESTKVENEDPVVVNTESQQVESPTQEQNIEDDSVVRTTGMSSSDDIQLSPPVEREVAEEPAGAPAEIPTSKGLDFASIARKMRDSITN